VCNSLIVWVAIVPNKTFRALQKKKKEEEKKSREGEERRG